MSVYRGGSSQNDHTQYQKDWTAEEGVELREMAVLEINGIYLNHLPILIFCAEYKASGYREMVDVIWMLSDITLFGI